VLGTGKVRVLRYFDLTRFLPNESVSNQQNRKSKLYMIPPIMDVSYNTFNTCEIYVSS
jgi:hypothetical protein